MSDEIYCRFIPEDMTFDHEAKSVATCLPEHYQPSIFTNSALQCSSVHLTYLLSCLLSITVCLSDERLLLCVVEFLFINKLLT